MLRFGDARLDGRDRGPRLLDGRPGLLHVQLRYQPGLRAPGDEIEDLVLTREVVLGDLQVRLVRAQLDVVARDLRRKRHLRRLEVRLARLEVGLGGADRARGGAEDVRLPARVEARAVQALGAGDVEALTAGDLPTLARPAPARRDGRGDARQEVLPRQPAARPCLPQSGPRTPQVGARLHRRVDQTRKRGVVEPEPPAGEILSSARGRDAGSLVCVLPGSRHGDRGRRRNSPRADTSHAQREQHQRDGSAGQPRGRALSRGLLPQVPSGVSRSLVGHPCTLRGNSTAASR